MTGSSAATTAFCSEKIDGPGGLCLYVDGNAKICRENGTYEAPKPNAFSLLAPEDCPGSTEVCRASCYVHGLRSAQPALYDLYRHNSKTIQKILDDELLSAGWAITFAAWISERCTSFRWHVSGDIFSEEYAAWIAGICMRSQPAEHWLYTRSSYRMLKPLLHVQNIVVNLSADHDNYAEARAAASLCGLRICYLATAAHPEIPKDLPSDSVVFPDYPLRPKDDDSWWRGLAPHHKKMVCPVDAWGKSEERRCGPCDRCLT